MALTALSGVALAENPVPFINQPLVPDAVAPSGAGFTLTVNGTGFVSGSVVNWNGHALTTKLVSASQLTASVPASDIAEASTVAVTVVSPAPGGGASSSVFFPITPAFNSVWVRSAFAAGSGPVSAVTADFNGDGKLDLAVANHAGNNVSVFLGNGNGTFQAAVNYDTGTGPWSGIAVGDFRGNGKLDLVVANYGSNNVSVLLGNGDGTFQAAVNYDTGVNPTWVAVADFDRDGKPDLVVSDQTGFISILLGNGDGTFQAHVDYAAGPAPNGVAVGDFNGDGKLDLAVANGSSNVASTVSILLGNGDGTFQAPVSYPASINPASVATVDFNHDGKLDLAVVNNIGSVSILLGNGDGTFQKRVDYGTGSLPWGTLGIGDLNGDGNLDLVVANSGSNTVSVFLGNGDGTFQTQVKASAGVDPGGAVVGDFNGDGRLDLAVTNGKDNTVSILRQVTTATLLPSSLTFADQIVESASVAQTLTLTDTGPLALTISKIAVTGADAHEFAQTNNCGSGLAAGATCTVSVTFRPTHTGPRSAAIKITDSAKGSPQSVTLSGTGVISGPDATFSSTQLTFATQLVGTSSPVQSLTLTDYGTAALSISIVASGDFSQTNTCGSSLAVLANCTISVTFTPTQIGTRTGTVSITDNAPGSPQMIALNGVGTVVELNPTGLAFSCFSYKNHTSCPPPAQTTTLTNTGSTPLTISNVAISGPFSQTNTCGSEVVAGGSCTFTVVFGGGLGAGHYTGALSIYDNGGGSPQTVALSGEHATE